MNLTGNLQINQRIERITPQDLIVGIDIAKINHLICSKNALLKI
ncbi:hypothetical protein ACFSTH_19865 [Paenibacillus yanchengensis]|uniref:Transposase n=1 Tax=Paenibacillus yanchengensis TaxID=2035833 RepID=A0ABW4YMX2_9BACL